MKTIKFSRLILGMIILLLSGCTTTNQIEPGESITDLLPQNTCGFYGEILTADHQPNVNEVIWLAKVVYDDINNEGYFIIDGGRSPSTISDSSGNFEFIGIDPADYVIIVGNLELNPYVLGQTDNPDKAKIFQCLENEVINTGKIVVTPNQ